MPVTIPLDRLLTVPGTRPLWPAELEALVVRIEAAPNDKVAWAVLADWLEEQGEPELAEACRWVHKRQLVEVCRDGAYGRREHWAFQTNTLPPAIDRVFDAAGIDTRSPLGLAVALAKAIAHLRNELGDGAPSTPGAT